jgi:hypothetical protein
VLLRRAYTHDDDIGVKCLPDPALRHEVVLVRAEVRGLCYPDSSKVPNKDAWQANGTILICLVDDRVCAQSPVPSISGNIGFANFIPPGPLSASIAIQAFLPDPH